MLSSKAKQWKLTLPLCQEHRAKHLSNVNKNKTHNLVIGRDPMNLNQSNYV